jgi:hypothetical protein
MSDSTTQENGVVLLPQHEALLRASAISPAVAAARGYRSITSASELLAAGYPDTQVQALTLPGLLIPIYDVFGENGANSYRPDADVRGRKYIQIQGRPLIVDVPRVVHPYLGDPSVPLWITESSRKADALVSAGFLAVAVTGVWGWRGRNHSGGTTALADFHEIAFKGKRGGAEVHRDVVICFDSDVTVNPNVHDAEEQFGDYLRRRGANVSYAVLPHPEEGKTGVDDYLGVLHATPDDLIRTITRFLPPVQSDPEVGPAPFPIAVLPPVLRRYVDEASLAIGVPHEMVALPMLAAVGAVVGWRACVQPKRGWREYPTLYMVCVAGSGKNKTAADNAARWPLIALQEDQRAVYTRQLADYDHDEEQWKNNPSPMRGPKPQKPQRRDLFTTSVTMEALADLLTRTYGLLISHDELVGWVLSMNQYRAGSDRQQYMQIHSNGPIKSDRKSGQAYVPHPVLAVYGGIQPDVVPKLRGDSLADDGFIQRVLPFVPIIPRKRWSLAEITPEAQHDVAVLYRTIDAVMPPPFPTGNDPGHAITLSPAALTTFAAWYDENAERAEAETGFVGAFYAKLEAHVARFALILHILNSPRDWSGPITVAEMRGAIAIGEYFRGQLDLFLPLLNARVLNTNRRPVGVSARTLYILQTAAENVQRSTFNGEKDEENDGWVSRRELISRLGNVKKEDLTNELDTCVDQGLVEVRQVSGNHRPRTDYRLRLDIG